MPLSTNSFGCCCKCPCESPITQWNINITSECPCLNGFIALTYVSNTPPCCVWTASKSCVYGEETISTTWTYKICPTGSTLTVTDEDGDILISWTGAANCTAPTNLTIASNTFPCNPTITIYPSCPEATSMVKCFDISDGTEIWNQTYRFGSPTTLGNEKLCTNHTSGKIHSGTLDFDAATGDVLFHFPHAETGGVAYIDSSGRRYLNNRTRYLTDGTLDATYPAEPLWFVPTHQGIIGLDDTWACYIINGAVWFINVGTGLYHRRSPPPPDGSGQILPWQEEGEVGIMSNFACYHNGKLYQTTGETYSVLGGSDGTGIKLSDRIYDAFADTWCCPGLHPQYSLQHAINTDGSFIMPTGHNPPSDQTTYRFLKCHPSSSTPISEMTITDLDDTALGIPPTGNLIFWYPSPSGDAIFLFQSGLYFEDPNFSGNYLMYYEWGNSTATWRRSFICPNDAYVGLCLHDGTYCYASTLADGGGGFIAGIPDPCTTVPHNVPEWSEGCLPSPCPASPNRASAGLSTPEVQVEVSGVVGNGECANCGDINGTYILAINGSGNYSYVGDDPLCSTCSTSPPTKFAIDYDGAVKFRLGAMTTGGIPAGCSNEVYDAIFFSKETEVVQLDLFQPYEFEFQPDYFAPLTRQCDWTNATVVVTGIQPPPPTP